MEANVVAGADKARPVGAHCGNCLILEQMWRNEFPALAPTLAPTLADIAPPTCAARLTRAPAAGARGRGSLLPEGEGEVAVAHLEKLRKGVRTRNTQKGRRWHPVIPRGKNEKQKTSGDTMGKEWEKTHPVTPWGNVWDTWGTWGGEWECDAFLSPPSPPPV